MSNLCLRVWLIYPQYQDTANFLIADSKAPNHHTTQLLYLLAGNHDKWRQFIFWTRLARFVRLISFPARDIWADWIVVTESYWVGRGGVAEIRYEKSIKSSADKIFGFMIQDMMQNKCLQLLNDIFSGN